MSNRKFFYIKILVVFALIVGCTSTYLKLDKKDEEFVKNNEFEEKVIIKPLVEASSLDALKNPAKNSITNGSSNATVLTSGKDQHDEEKSSKKSSSKKKSKSRKTKTKNTKKKSTQDSELISGSDTEEKNQNTTEISDMMSVQKEKKREPDIEDSEGFEGRRPIKDPFHVGEEVVHDVQYFKLTAGELKLKVEPFAEVNGKKTYAFATELKSSSMFSTFYSLEDRAVTYVDFFDLIPHVFTLSVKESGQIKDARGLFDINKNSATYWEKKVTKKNGQEEMKKEWDIPTYSQNVFSAAYYMRLFKWEIGKEYSFRVADAGENLIFKGKAIRKEKLTTEAGKFNTIVVKPEITVKGVFRPIGDIYFWLSDDDRKFILRIESSIKIGTIVSEVVRLNPGN